MTNQGEVLKAAWQKAGSGIVTSAGNEEQRLRSLNSPQGGRPVGAQQGARGWVKVPEP